METQWHQKKNNDEKGYSRGGSDRSFLEVIQILGNEFGTNNKIIFVDSSSGEVERPSTKKSGLIGISDIYDNLKFDIIFKNGPKEYISWFIELANKRSNFKKNSWLFNSRMTVYKYIDLWKKNSPQYIKNL